MGYEVIARKWRPQTFEDVVSQLHVKTTLVNAIKADRVAHSYIFAGPRGVGKTTIARILARALNCMEGPTITPCNKCVACIEILEDRSMDVLEIDGASNRGIEDVRNIRENIKYAPMHGKKRIYIIDEVHMLTREAFNALLKTLEEPPSHVLFIFATTEFHKIPATIYSRCQRFDFRRMALDETVNQLKMICDAEGIEISDEALVTISKRGDGSMRDAESLLDQMIASSGSKIDTDDVVASLGFIREETFFECSKAVYEKDLAQAFNISRQIFDDGYDLSEFLNGLLEHFRNLLLVKVSNNATRIETTENIQAAYLEISKLFSDMDILCVINTISEAEFAIKKSVQPLLRLELLLSKLFSLTKTSTIDNQHQDSEGESTRPVFPKVKSASKPEKKAEVIEPGEVIEPQTSEQEETEAVIKQPEEALATLIEAPDGTIITNAPPIPETNDFSEKQAMPEEQPSYEVQPLPLDDPRAGYEQEILPIEAVLEQEDVAEQAPDFEPSQSVVNTEVPEIPEPEFDPHIESTIAETSEQDESTEEDDNSDEPPTEKEPIDEQEDTAEPEGEQGILSIFSIKESWGKFLDAIHKKFGLTGALLDQSAPVGFNDNVIEISLSRDYAFNASMIQRNKDKINEALKEFFGVAISFICKVETESTKKSDTLRMTSFKSDHEMIEEMIEHEPILKRIIDTFDGQAKRILASS